MSGTGRLRAVVFLLLAIVANPANAQYMYLDANGDGVNDASDRLDPSGTTMLDIWVDTDSNRDGSPATCDVDPTTRLSIASWEIVLHALGGTVQWGPLDNVFPVSPNPGHFSDPGDTTDPRWYHNGWGGFYIRDPGRYRVARLQVHALTGSPAIVFEPFNPSQPTDLTSFGTQCSAKEDDNTYKLGLDWQDTDGIADDLVADAGGPYLGVATVEMAFSALLTLNRSGRSISYAWDFGDGGTGTGATPTHTYAATGEYTVSLTVTDGEVGHSTWTTAKIIEQTPPVARAGGPYSGFVHLSLFFDGRGSSDANGDRLGYTWDFGDGAWATGSYAWHTYNSPGTYAVKLSVYDGHFTVADLTTATISSGPQTPPIANAGGPYQGFVGIPLALNGTGSYDPEGQPLHYHWWFGDVGEGLGPSPSHTYAEAGDYEVILEVSDGTFTTSSAATASITVPPGSPPVVSTGGPYRAVAGEAVELDGRGTTDPDGDSLVFWWSFGDISYGHGSVRSHSYAEPGIYTATLAVTDGIYDVSASTTVTVSAPGGLDAARAFLRSGAQSIGLSATGAGVVLQIEPVDGSFRLDDVDVNQVVLRCDGPNATYAIHPSGRLTPGGDQDGNGVEELSATFRTEDLRELLGHIDRPAPATLELEGTLWQHGLYRATVRVQVIPAGGRFAAIVRPNPFNPQATVTFGTSKRGRVRAEVFSIGGRLVKTLIRDEMMDAGSHDVVIDARGDHGATLSSGVYFLRISGPDGPVTTRITIAK